jgi:hypothetical protein
LSTNGQQVQTSGGFSQTDGVSTNLLMYPLGISGDTVVGFRSIFADGKFIPMGTLETGGVYTTLSDPLGVNGTWITGMDGATLAGYYQDAAFNFHGFTATLDVPEPATVALLLCGAVSFLMPRRRGGA